MVEDLWFSLVTSPSSQTTSLIEHKDSDCIMSHGLDLGVIAVLMWVGCLSGTPLQENCFHDPKRCWALLDESISWQHMTSANQTHMQIPNNRSSTWRLWIEESLYLCLESLSFFKVARYQIWSSSTLNEFKGQSWCRHVVTGSSGMMNYETAARERGAAV